MNNKGFTLVELIVSVVILGLLAAMSVPTLSLIKSKMDQKKFISYGDGLISAAKIYTDSYSEDMFSDSNVYLVQFDELLNKNLVKDIGISDITCNNENTYVIVSKHKKSYSYCLSLKCTSFDGETTIYDNSDSDFGTSNGMCGDTNVYSVNVDCNGGTGSFTKTFLRGETFEFSSSVCSKTGSTLNEYEVSDGTGNFIESVDSSKTYKIKSSLNFKAKWDGIGYTLSYDNKCGTCTPNSKNGTYGEKWGTLCSPVKAGFTFDGWTDSSGNKVDENTIVKKSINVKSKCTKIDYTPPSVKVYTYNNSNYKNPIDTFTINGNSTFTINSDDYSNNVSKWLNNVNYPNGIYFKFVYSDSGDNNSGIASTRWSVNGGNILSTNADYKTFKTNKSNTEKLSSINYSITVDGQRYARFIVYDNAGNSTTIYIKVNLDLTGPTFASASSTSPRITYFVRGNVGANGNCQLVPNTGDCNFASNSWDSGKCQNIDFFSKSGSKYNCENYFDSNWREKKSNSQKLTVYGPSDLDSYIKITSMNFTDNFNRQNKQNDYISNSSSVKLNQIVTVSSRNNVIIKKLILVDKVGSISTYNLEFHYIGAGTSNEVQHYMWIWKYKYSNLSLASGWVKKTWVRMMEGSYATITGYWYYSDRKYKLVTSNIDFCGNGKCTYVYTRKNKKYYDACSYSYFMNSKEGCELAGWYKIGNYYYYFWTREGSYSLTKYAWGELFRDMNDVVLCKDSEDVFIGKESSCTKSKFNFDSKGHCTNCTGTNVPIVRNYK